jgi:predicted XRE-type DNA-binding protein
MSDETAETFESVWDAIEDTPEEAANMKLRSALTMAINDHIRASGWTQQEAARRLRVTQPRISDLMRGKIDLFGLDTLVNMITAAGLQVQMHVAKAA